MHRAYLLIAIPAALVGIAYVVLLRTHWRADSWRSFPRRGGRFACRGIDRAALIRGAKARRRGKS